MTSVAISPRHRILAFDCSGASCSVAFARDGQVRATSFEAMERGQSERLVPMIAEILDAVQEHVTAIDAFLTTVGPGSFTGVRIGLAAAQGFRLATGKPVLAMTSFEAAFASLDDGAVHETTHIVIDSRRGALFVQPFDAAGRLRTPPYAVDPLPFLDRLRAASDAPRLVAGDAAMRVAALAETRGVTIEAQPKAIRADAMLRALVRRLHAPDDARPILERPLRPLYLREPDVTMPKIVRAAAS